ncbi:MAG: hypothetical protein KDA42_07440 [Planctomycetales bacterium]|nr:hypothetical protein [Planctomycetales bacterium]
MPSHSFLESFNRRLFVFLWSATVLSGAVSLCATCADADELTQQEQAARSAYEQQLNSLAELCREQRLSDEAQWTQAWLIERDPAKLFVFDVDGADPVASITDDSEMGDARWRKRFLELRRRRADELFDICQQLASAGRASEAMIGLTEVLREGPQHAEARRILGYVQHEGRWLTTYAARMMQLGMVWDERFGWVNTAHLPRYEKGERRFGARWVSAEQEQLLRRNIRDGWLVRTDHYKLTTNHSLEEGVRLAGQLENLHFVFRNVFAGYYVPSDDLIRWFRGRGRLPISPVQHDIVYFRQRDEYNQALRREQPNIEITLGIYFDRRREAFFFAGEGQDEGTLYHEGTHQLFQEIRGAARNTGAEQNFWAVEGVATYMESLTRGPGYFTLGGFTAGRVPTARERILAGGFYLPIAELVAMGKLDVQRSPDIGKIYTQAAGLATFLMHYDRGRYREAMIDYLAEIYAGRDDRESLSRLTGSKYEQLDREYHEFLRSAPLAEAAGN